MGSNRDVRGLGKCYAPRKMGSGTESRLDIDNIKNIILKYCWVREVSFAVYACGPFFIHTLELRFKRQIFIIFIVDYIYKKGFLKIENF